MERIDVRGDLLGLIHTQRNAVADDESLWSSQIFFGANLCHISALPLPPTNRQLTAEVLPDSPCYLDQETASVYSKMTLLRKKSQPTQPMIFGSSQGLGVYDGRPEECSPEAETDECTEKGEGEWYECAEDALAQLVNLQSSLRQRWMDLINEFNFEESPSSPSGLDSPSQVSGLTVESGDEKNDPEGDNLSELISLRESLDKTPPAEGFPEKVQHFQNTEDIMASWGLLDLVQVHTESLDGHGAPSESMRSSVPPLPHPSDALFHFESGSLL
jgi:hypothetical protein